MHNGKTYPGPAAFFSAGPEFYIAYNFSTGDISVIKRKDTYKYSQLSGIKTDEDHLKDLLELKDPSWGIREYEKLISYLKKEKLLIPLSDVPVEETQNLDAEYETAIITCDRPCLLVNSFESIAERLMKINPEISITIFDDSVNDENVIKNRQLTADIENKYKIKTSYFGKTEKNCFMENLLSGLKNREAGKDLLEFALFGDNKFSSMKGPGGNRNAVLLKLSGRKIFIFDDDVKYLFGTTPEPDNDIEVSYTKNPEKKIFPNTKLMMSYFKYADFDAMNYANAVLGKSVGTLIKKAENNNGLIISDKFRPEPGYSLEDTDSTVKAAVFGIYGGRWYSKPYGVLFTEGIERKKSFKNKSSYKKTKENPIHLMMSCHLTLSRAASFIATAAGVNAKGILPPFPPYGRNSDGIWATVMLALNRKSFISQLPLAIFHDVENKSPFIYKDFEDTSASFGIITVLIIEQIKKKLFSIFPDISYELLGEKLICVSELSDKQFFSLCYDLWLEYTGNLILRLENLLIKYKGKPKYWKEDAEKYLSLLAEQGMIPENSIPKELRDNYSTEESIRLYKKFFSDYGELIINWPVIWEEACKPGIKRNCNFD